MKKFIREAITAVILVGICTGCTQKEDSSKGNTDETEKATFAAIAEETDKATPAPEGLDIVTDRTQFQPVTENQDYVFGTDHQFYLANDQEFVETEDAFYFIQDAFKLCVFDKETKECRILCNKPECKHEIEIGKETTCTALLVDRQGLFYYQGYLYTIFREFDEGKKADIISLYKISTDGSSREKVCQLAMAYHPQEEEPEEGSDAIFSIWGMQHRGYLYYCYNYGTGGTTSGFYNNGSNVLYRMKMEGSGEPEVITPVKLGGTESLMGMIGIGSYLYFVQPDELGMGELYRLNTESMKIEAMQLGDIAQEDYCVIDGKIIYKKQYDSLEFYEFTPETGEDKLLFTMPEKEGYQCLFPEYDGENIMVTYLSLDGKEKRITEITDTEGTILGEYITKDEDTKDTTWLTTIGGHGEYYFYYYLSEEMERAYMEKKDMKDSSVRPTVIKVKGLE